MTLETKTAGMGLAGRWPTRYTLLALTFLAAFICYIDRVNISVAALAMQEAFGWSETTKGFVLSSFFIGYMLFQVPGGWLANRVGGKVVMGIAVLWWSAFTMLTPLASMISLPILLAARIAMGLGEAATFPAAYNLFARWTPPAERTRFVAVLLSGVPIGTLFALTTTGVLVTRYGWPSVFYLFGLAGLVWAILWFLLASNDPRDHPRISAAERALLDESRPAEQARLVTPWAKLLKAPAVWALIINHLCSNWSLYFFLSWLPSYFREVQHLTIINAGLFSAAPWLTMFTMVNVSAWIADALIARKVSVTFVRKLLQVTGLLAVALFLLLARNVASPPMALAIMCGALGALGLTWSGFAVNHLDIAPRYAGELMGITNTAGTIPGIIGVAAAGWLIDRTGTYDAAFALVAGVTLLGALIWILFASGKPIID